MIFTNLLGCVAMASLLFIILMVFRFAIKFTKKSKIHQIQGQTHVHHAYNRGRYITVDLGETQDDETINKFGKWLKDQTEIKVTFEED